MIRNRLALQFTPCRVLLLLFAATRIAGAAPLALPALVIPAKVSVPGAKIYLGNLLTKESRSVLPEAVRLDSVFIAASPEPGQTRVLEGSDISNRLEELGITGARYALRVPERIRVERDAQTLSPGDIAAVIESGFLPQLPWDEVHLEEIGLVKGIVLPAGFLELSFQRPPNADLARPFYLNINFRIDGQIVKRSFIRTVLAISHTVAVAGKDLDPSVRMASADVRWEKRRLSSTVRIAVSGADFFENRKPRLKILSGEILTENMFMVAPLVKRGDSVMLIFEDQRVHVTAQGVSLTSGSKGDRIRVMNLASRKEMTAEVMNERTVRVNF